MSDAAARADVAADAAAALLVGAALVLLGAGALLAWLVWRAQRDYPAAAAASPAYLRWQPLAAAALLVPACAWTVAAVPARAPGPPAWLHMARACAGSAAWWGLVAARAEALRAAALAVEHGRSPAPTVYGTLQLGQRRRPATGAEGRRRALLGLPLAGAAAIAAALGAAAAVLGASVAYWLAGIVPPAAALWIVVRGARRTPAVFGGWAPGSGGGGGWALRAVRARVPALVAAGAVQAAAGAWAAASAYGVSASAVAHPRAHVAPGLDGDGAADGLVTLAVAALLALGADMAVVAVPLALGALPVWLAAQDGDEAFADAYVLFRAEAQRARARLCAGAAPRRRSAAAPPPPPAGDRQRRRRLRRSGGGGAAEARVSGTLPVIAEAEAPRGSAGHRSPPARDTPGVQAIGVAELDEEGGGGDAARDLDASLIAVMPTAAARRGGLRVRPAALQCGGDAAVTLEEAQRRFGDTPAARVRALSDAMRAPLRPVDVDIALPLAAAGAERAFELPLRLRFHPNAILRLLVSLEHFNACANATARVTRVRDIFEAAACEDTVTVALRSVDALHASPQGVSAEARLQSVNEHECLAAHTPRVEPPTFADMRRDLHVVLASVARVRGPVAPQAPLLRTGSAPLRRTQAAAAAFGSGGLGGGGASAPGGVLDVDALIYLSAPGSPAAGTPASPALSAGAHASSPADAAAPPVSPPGSGAAGAAAASRAGAPLSSGAGAGAAPRAGAAGAAGAAGPAAAAAAAAAEKRHSAGLAARRRSDTRYGDAPRDLERYHERPLTPEELHAAGEGDGDSGGSSDYDVDGDMVAVLGALGGGALV